MYYVETWDPLLAAYAQESLERVCKLRRRPATVHNLKFLKARGVSENFATLWNSPGIPAPSAEETFRFALQSWLAEKQSYAYEDDECSGHTCAHFKAVVWRDATSLGCAVAAGICARGAHFSFLSCIYSPAVNLCGMRPFGRTQREVCRCLGDGHPDCLAFAGTTERQILPGLTCQTQDRDTGEWIDVACL